MTSPRTTLQTQLVLRALLEDPSKEPYGLALCESVGLPSGTIYPILARLEQVRWVESFWEDADRHVTEARQRRRYYRLTPDGAEQARQALASSYRTKSPNLLWNPEPGIAGGSR